MGEHSAILRNINEQLAGLTNEISNLQRRLDTTETYISNMSNTQASLIHQMAAKPEAAPPPENNPAKFLKTMSTSVATIRVFEEVKTFSTHEYPNAYKHVNVKISGIGEVKTLGRRSPQNLESVNFFTLTHREDLHSTLRTCRPKCRL